MWLWTHGKDPSSVQTTLLTAAEPDLWPRTRGQEVTGSGGRVSSEHRAGPREHHEEMIEEFLQDWPGEVIVFELELQEFKNEYLPSRFFC